MARQKAIDALSEEHKQQLDEKLINQGFFNYQGLADWLNSLGYKISRTATHRYGKQLERKIQAIKDATLMSQIISEQIGDDIDVRSEAMIAMMQTRMLDVMVQLDEQAPEQELAMIMRAAKAIGDLSKASRDHKKFQAEVVRRMQDEFDKLKDEGNDADTLDRAIERIKSVYGLD